MHVERNAVGTALPPAFPRGFGGDFRARDQIAQGGEFAGHRDRHVGFRGQIRFDDEGVVVVGEQGDLAGAVQSHGKAPHHVIFDRRRHRHRQVVKVVEIIGNGPDVKDAPAIPVHEQDWITPAVGHGAHERPGVIGEKINLRKQNIGIVSPPMFRPLPEPKPLVY